MSRAENLRVCVVTPSRFHVIDLANNLALEGHDVSVFAGIPRRRLGVRAPAAVRTLPIVAVPVTASRIGLTRTYRQTAYASMTILDRWVAKVLPECDVFHFMSGFGLRSVETARRYRSLIVCDRSSTHIVVQDRLLREEHDRWELAYRPIDPRVVNRELAEYGKADRIVTPSSFARRSFLEQGIPENKVYRVMFGVDTSLFSPQTKQDDTFRVLYVGTLSVRKGIGYLLQAIAELREQHRVELCIVGPKTPEGEALLSRYPGIYRYLGVKSRSELSWYYSQASVFVQPAIEEGLSYVLGQAMACRVPLVATTNTGAEDLIEDGVEGFIVPIRSPDAIAAALTRMIDDPDLRGAMAEAALSRAQRLLGWTEYAASMMTVYREATG